MSHLTPQQALDLARAHHHAGRLGDAEAIYRQILAWAPNHADALHWLGVIALQVGQLEAAADFIQRAIAANAGVAAYHSNLGVALTALGRCEEAIASLRRALELQPAFADAHYNLGNALRNHGRPREAVAAYREAIRVQPNFADAYSNLGVALKDLRAFDEALAVFHQAIQLRPDLASAHSNLGIILHERGQIDEAAAAYRRALALAPDFADAHNNLGNALKDRGCLDEAVAALRRAIQLQPQHAIYGSNLILTLQYSSACSTAELALERRRWNDAHAAPLRAHWRAHENIPDPARRLRVGYVSTDLRDHVVGRTLLPCFEAHDREQFEFVVYSGSTAADAVRERFRRGSVLWRETSALSDEKLAATIREDRIDLLVDLSLHTAGHRLRVFARKPAPVQLSWLGCPGTSGLAAMDYRISDSFLEPPGAAATGEAEQALLMPDAWCCYAPPVDSPAPGDLPAVRTGRVTFGSFNQFAKVNERVLTRWAAILREVAGSRLLLLSKGGAEERTRETLAACGIAPERVAFLPYHPAAAIASAADVPFDYLLRYRQVDIALDSFPYNGMTTTGDALWMGVPVVALIGTTPISRASFSLLSNVGLPELAARSEEEYVAIATSLARDLPRLAALRATLRARMEASPLLDPARFTRHLEAAFRTIWQRWCASRGGVV